MERLDIIRMADEAFRRGEYSSISEAEYNGKTTIRIVLGKGVSMFVGEDGSLLVRAIGYTNMTSITYEELKKLIQKDFDAYKEERIGKWQAQIDVLQNKINDAKRGETSFYQARKEKPGFFKRLFHLK